MQEDLTRLESASQGSGNETMVEDRVTADVATTREHITREHITAQLLDLLYVPNVLEDWEALKDLVDYLQRRKPQLVLLTNILDNPLGKEDRIAFHHANKYVLEAFHADGNFSGISQFLESFRHDGASDITAVSARKILALIESGKKALGEKLDTLVSILRRSPCPYYIVPGPFEDLDMIRFAGPAGLASRYLTVRKVEQDGYRILGVGGLPVLSDECPVDFQEREYFEGSAAAEEYLQDVIGDDVDILVSNSPIEHFADPGEEKLVRKFLSQRLPGKVILTSQSLGDFQKTLTTASGAELIRGGSFAKQADGPSRTFWELVISRKGVNEKSLFELKGKRNFRLL